MHAFGEYDLVAPTKLQHPIYMNEFRNAANVARSKEIQIILYDCISLLTM